MVLNALGDILIMAGKTQYQLAIDALRKHDGKVIGIPALKSLIAQKLASSESRVIGYLKMLDAQGITKETEQFRVRIKIPKGDLK